MHGTGPGADSRDEVKRLLLEGVFQQQVESESIWSPVLIEGPPLDREHRDSVRWHQGAADYLVIGRQTLEHPLFPRLHFLLR